MKGNAKQKAGRPSLVLTWNLKPNPNTSPARFKRRSGTPGKYFKNIDPTGSRRVRKYDHRP